MLYAVLFSLLLGVGYVVWHRLARPSTEVSIVVAVALAALVVLAVVLAGLGLPAPAQTVRHR